MKAVVTILSFLFAVSAHAEHNAKYCGSALPGNSGTDLRGSTLHKTNFDIILEVKCNSYVLSETYSGFAGVWGLTSQQIRSIFQSKRQICVKARWGGPNPCDNSSLFNIETTTDAVENVSFIR